MLLKHISEYTSYPIAKSIYGLSGSKENSIRLEYNSNLSNALIEQAENMADTKIRNKMKKFRESNVEYNDMTDEEIIQIYGLDKKILNKYGNRYTEKQKSMINYLISFDKDRIQELTDFYLNQICNAEQEFIEEM